MKIICGTDFSVYASEAATVAAALTPRSNSTIKLVHAMSGDPPHLSLRQCDGRRDKVKRKLMREGQRLRALGAEVQESIITGAPHEVLTTAAKRSNAGLIIVSSLGHVSPTRWLIGSVAERTAQNATVPTLVVRDSGRLVSWTQGKHALKVFVCCDSTRSSDAAIRWTTSLKGLGPLDISVAYASWPPEETRRFGIGGDRPFEANSPQVKSLLERDLKARCEALLGGEKVSVLVASAWGPTENLLLEMAKITGADLIVVGTNRRRRISRFWYGSVSREILRHAATNVVCVPMTDETTERTSAVPTYRRVLVPTDFSSVANKAIASAHAAVQPNGEICLVHVIPPRSVFKNRHPQANDRCGELKNKISARMRSVLPQGNGFRRVKSHVEVVEHEHPDVAICQAAERFNADLICMGSGGRTGIKRKLLGSVAESVMRRSKRTVLVVRE